MDMLWFLQGTVGGVLKGIYIYRREQNFTHPISKALQWLAWYPEFWAGQGWSYILLCWGHFLYTPWDWVCRFSRKNLRGDFWEKVPNFGYYNSVYQASHCSALLIGCLKFCSRLCIYMVFCSFTILILE